MLVYFQIIPSCYQANLNNNAVVSFAFLTTMDKIEKDIRLAAVVSEGSSTCNLEEMKRWGEIPPLPRNTLGLLWFSHYKLQV
jgi:hypothetical protein